MMIRGGDAIKVKIRTGNNSHIEIYSAYPEDLSYADSPTISNDCKSSERWAQKDLRYVIAEVTSEALQSLWFVYGDCYFASRDFYQKALNITDPLQLTKFNFLKENSLPLIRSTALPPKCLIKKPADSGRGFLNALMSKKKYESFSITNRHSLEALKDNGLLISDCTIRSPNDSSLLMDAKFISYQYLQ